VLGTQKIRERILYAFRGGKTGSICGETMFSWKQFSILNFTQNLHIIDTVQARMVFMVPVCELKLRLKLEFSEHKI